MNKCKGCQWYGKPYWSIINPCDNCPREETNVQVFTRWQDPTIEEKDKEIERLNNIINELEKDIDNCIKVGVHCQVASFNDGLNDWEYYNGELLAYEKMLNRLRELKEENK